MDRLSEDVNRNWSDSFGEEKIRAVNIPSKPAVKRIRSANSLVFCKNSCKPGRSKTVT